MHVGIMNNKMNIEEIAEMMQEDDEKRRKSAIPQFVLGLNIANVDGKIMPNKPIKKTKLEQNPGGLPPLRASLLKEKIPFKEKIYEIK